MSSDQQYPYDPERGYGTQPPPPQQQYGRQQPQPHPEQAQPPRPHPQGPAYVPYDAQDGAPGASSDGSSDMESTQTWQGQTWDTASQPAVRRPDARGQASYDPQARSQPRHAARQPFGEGERAQSYQEPRQYPYAQQQPPVQPQHPHAQQQSFQQQQQQHQQPQHQQPQHQQPQQQQNWYATPGSQSPVPPAAPHHGAPYAPGPQQPSPMEETAYLPAPGPVAAAPAAQAPGAPLPPEVPVTGRAAQPPAAAPTELLPPVPAHAGSGHGGIAQAGPAQPGSAQAGPAQAAPGTGPVTAPPPGPAGPGSGPSGYNPPTTLGNARITDAQRARAEGRSPIIPPGIQPAALTAVLGLLLAGGAALGSYALLVPVVILQAVTAAGWFRLNGMWPARQGIALAFLGGLVSDVALLAAGKDNAPAAIIGTLGVWVLLTVVLQLRSHADPDTRLSGLFATVVSAALAIIATGFLASSSDAVIVGAVAVAAATVVRALPLPGPASVVAALIVAAGAGLVMGAVTDLGSKGVVLGLGAGVCALVGLRAASYDYPSRFVHMTAGVALPLTAAAPVVYLLGRALG